MNKLIMTFAIAVAIAFGCGTAGTTFADETPTNDASQGPKEGPKAGLKEGLKEGPKEGQMKRPGTGCRCCPNCKSGLGRGPKGGRPRFDRDGGDGEGPKDRPQFGRGRGPRPGREGGRRGFRRDVDRDVEE